MADVRPFRALRYNAERADPSRTIAPPYDVISPEQQASLYARSEYNIVRVEYGEQWASDTESDSRYTRAARDLDVWRAGGVLVRDATPAIYVYEQQFEWEDRRHERTAYFAAVRLEEWDKGIIKPHEHTLSGPKADRLDLLRATRTQVSPVYSLFRSKGSSRSAFSSADFAGASELLYAFEADGQRHALSALRDAGRLRAFADHLAASDVYIADGHHRYETALTYRNECRARASSWTGEEPENFVLMALTDAADPGLLVLPTHRLLSPPRFPADALDQLARHFSIVDVTQRGLTELTRLLASTPHNVARFGAIGLASGSAQVLTLEDRHAIEKMMPADQPASWKRLDVSVLQYGILAPIFGIDDAVLMAGGAVSYTQDASAAADAVASSTARAAFILNATPVDHVLAVADEGARMPQKSTYFYPKLPTGLVLNSLD
ncbi:MAG: DUF1015 domain-containing protein [Chloroflexota bacterium]|nr:DUF1015 domain-containing protein [Chloroflexota bacterium]